MSWPLSSVPVTVTFGNGARIEPGYERATNYHTGADIIYVIERIEFRGGLSRLNARFHVKPDMRYGQEMVSITFSLDVLERDSGVLAPVSMQRDYAIASLKMKGTCLYELAMDIVKDLLIHEAFESFFVNGHIWQDPHRK